MSRLRTQAAAQVLPVLQGPRRVHRLQGRAAAAQVHDRPWQDQAAPRVGQLRSAPARALDGHQARSRDGARPVHRSGHQWPHRPQGRQVVIAWTPAPQRSATRCCSRRRWFSASLCRPPLRSSGCRSRQPASRGWRIAARIAIAAIAAAIGVRGGRAHPARRCGLRAPGSSRPCLLAVVLLPKSTSSGSARCSSACSRLASVAHDDVLFARRAPR